MTDLKIIPREMRIAGKQTLVESETTLVPAKTLDALAATARHEHELVVSAGQKMLAHAVLCGDALREAKARVKRGEWMRWIEENANFNRSTASFYMRASFYVDLLRENGIESANAARAFLKEHDHRFNSSATADEQVRQIRKLAADGLKYREIANLVGVESSTVSNYLNDPRRGKRKPGGRMKGTRRSGRRSKHFTSAITDDVVEGAAIKLREMFGPGAGDITDSDRNDAVSVLRAAFTYDGPIPGEQP